MKRKQLSKAVRRKVYEKYYGHCAYCGKEIKYEEMQIDHAIAFAQSIYGEKDEREKGERMIRIDIELPKTCFSCPLYISGWCRSKKIHERILHNDAIKKRHDKCPMEEEDED